MSLNRVVSLETFTIDPAGGTNGSPASLSPGMVTSRRGSDASSDGRLGIVTRGRRVSFNPLPERWDPPVHRADAVRAVGPFDVPRWKRLLQVFVAVVYCALAAGIVFGFAALKPVLKDEGAYSRECAAAADDDDPDPDARDTCVELRLNFMFTVAAVGSNVAALPIGAILDHWGPRTCGLLGSSLLAVGALLMALAAVPARALGREAAVDLPFDGLMFGYLCLALGGPFTYISAFQLSNAFPGNSGLVMALITGAFDASSAVFLVYRLAYQATGGAPSLHRFFLAYLTIPATIAVLQVVLMPKQSYKTVTELVVEARQEPGATGPLGNTGYHDPLPPDEHTALLRQSDGDNSDDHHRSHRRAHVNAAADTSHVSAEHSVQDVLESFLGPDKADDQTRSEAHKEDASGVWGAMHGRSARRQIASPWFVLMCLFTVVQMTRINYFVATVRAQYESLLGSAEAAATINNYFDIALPVGGLLAVPFIGALLDRSSTAGVLASLVTTAAVIGGLGVVPGSLWAAYAGISLFVLYRPFYYTAVSDYSAKVFGFETFGTVYGLMICLAGVLNFGQSGLDHLFHHTFGGDPVPVNLILLAIGAVAGAALVGFVAAQAARVRVSRQLPSSQLCRERE